LRPFARKPRAWLREAVSGRLGHEWGTLLPKWKTTTDGAGKRRRMTDGEKLAAGQ
jgi:hypothetical protein